MIVDITDRRKISKNQHIREQNFLNNAKKLHDDRYDYSDMVYKNDKTDIIIKCNIHGPFIQSPNNHLRGQGCRLCGEKLAAEKITKSAETYFQEVAEVHNNRYDYSKSEYTHARNKIIIICPKHGEFLQSASAHLSQATGCPKCSNWISRMETEWLDSLSISDEFRQKILYINNKRIKVDAFDPTINTIYEFWGDYWHGNPVKYKADGVNVKNKKTFGELFEETQRKRQLIIGAGYNLVEKWETE